jgi:hypothetical protein
MADSFKLGVLSDIHYAGAAEKARGSDYELRRIGNPLLRVFVRAYRGYFWMRDPLEQGRFLDRFLAEGGPFDFVVANGDYSCNTECIGVSDPAACESVAECLGKLRERFGANLALTCGDHELGKISFFGGKGGMRLESWRVATTKLQLQPFWRKEFGKYVLLGVTSSLAALPVFERDVLPEERPEWERLRAGHLCQVARAFENLRPEQRVLLFCHDPTALPFLWQQQSIRARVGQIEQTIIGHLHSELILWKSRRLAGMPRLTFLGHTARRMSSALRQARDWRPFKVRLCPALAGIQLLKDGGYLVVEFDLQARRSPEFRPVRWAR